MDGSHQTYFYPRPPRGGRPLLRGRIRRSMRISIHALREEGDPISSTTSLVSSDFYPRPPRGGRLQRRTNVKPRLDISIHALREEGDVTFLSE